MKSNPVKIVKPESTKIISKLNGITKTTVTVGWKDNDDNTICLCIDSLDVGKAVWLDRKMTERLIKALNKYIA